MLGPRALVEVFSRQGRTEYKILDGFEDCVGIKARVGNEGKDLYDQSYDGMTDRSRKEAVKRMEADINSLEDKLNKLKFSLKVTRNKNWVEIKD